MNPSPIGQGKREGGGEGRGKSAECVTKNVTLRNESIERTFRSLKSVSFRVFIVELLEVS